MNNISSATEYYKEVLKQDNTHVEAIACIGSNHFYSDQPEVLSGSTGTPRSICETAFLWKSDAKSDKDGTKMQGNNVWAMSIWDQKFKHPDVLWLLKLFLNNLEMQK